MELTVSLKEHFKKMLAYDQWANDLLLKDIEALPSPDPTALGRLSHILTAQDLWLTRLLEEDLSRFKSANQERTLAECREKLTEMGKKWGGYLENLKSEDFGKIISYKNTKGQPFQLPVSVIVGHAFDHSTYHRGQIATDIKRAGGQHHSPGFHGYVLEHSA